MKNIKLIKTKQKQRDNSSCEFLNVSGISKRKLFKKSKARKRVSSADDYMDDVEIPYKKSEDGDF